MSNLKIKDKKREQTKALNKKIKESFSQLKDVMDSGKLSVIRSLNGVIFCSYDTHPDVMFVAAQAKNEEIVDGQTVPQELSTGINMRVEEYVNLDAMPKELSNIVREYVRAREKPEDLEEILVKAKKFDEEYRSHAKK